MGVDVIHWVLLGFGDSGGSVTLFSLFLAVGPSGC